MTTAQTENAVAKRWEQASIANSLLLPATAALHLNVTFWVLVLTNFLLMHGVWVAQLMRLRSWKGIDWAVIRWPLIAFAVLGNFSLLLWQDQLLSVFPS